MALIGISESDLVGRGVIPLDDIPGLSADEMKAKFEEVVRAVVIPKFNAAIDTLNTLLYFDEHGQAYFTVENLVTSYSVIPYVTDAMKIPSAIAIRDMDAAWKNLITTSATEIYNRLLNELSSLVGTPLTASTAAGMTDKTKIYVYTGSETGYVNGDWYYWDGTAWADGGTYNSTAFDTDTTLAVSGAAADAKVAGDRINATQADIAPTYSTSAQYAVGDLVIRNDQLYRCKTAITIGESWTAAHWESTDVETEINSVESYADAIKARIDAPTKTSIGSASSFSAGTTPTLGTAITADEITAWSPGVLPSLSVVAKYPDKVNSWSAGSLPSASVSEGVMTLTKGTLPSLSTSSVAIDGVYQYSNGTLPSLTKSTKSIPNVTDVGTAPSLTITDTDVVTSI